ncbi:hypothetical protein [Aureispira anguillae]|uniref:hypothetical protein n=1 Tax=Aureispira anguillae TaxID=2864201 RepID=UPI0022317B6C|nr:hypothetical protein [Aureispira anguillae]
MNSKTARKLLGASNLLFLLGASTLFALNIYRYNKYYIPFSQDLALEFTASEAFNCYIFQMIFYGYLPAFLLTLIFLIRRIFLSIPFTCLILLLHNPFWDIDAYNAVLFFCEHRYIEGMTLNDDPHRILYEFSLTHLNLDLVYGMAFHGFILFVLWSIGLMPELKEEEIKEPIIDDPYDSYDHLVY